MLCEQGGPLGLAINDLVDNFGTCRESVDCSTCLRSTLPLLNSSVMICWVEAMTLCVAHIDGYAGVMIGIRWFLS